MRAATIFQLTLGVAFLVPASLAIAARVAENGEPELGLVEGRLRDCPSTPNCVCSEEGGLAPLTFEGDPMAAWAALGALLEATPRVEQVTWTEAYGHVVFRSALFRFPDDVEFRLDAPGGRIHVRSASRIGHSDLGANERRVELLRKRWNER
jgi:uncharacterized protein (DUF1499 family)